MTPLSQRRIKILQDLDRHILYASDVTHYYHALLGFLCKKMQAQTILFAFSDPERKIVNNPIVYGKPLLPVVSAVAAKMVAGKQARFFSTSRHRVIWKPLSLHGKRLGWAGAILAPKTPVTPIAEAQFSLLCESLKKDFLFVRDQLLQRRRLTDLNTIYQISQAVSTTLDPDKLLKSIASVAKDKLHAEASSLGIIDTASQEIVFTVATGVKKAAIQQKRMRWNEGIIGAVVSKGKPLLIEDAQKDPRFYRQMDRETGFTTHSVLCVPMKIRNHVIGAVEVLNPIDRKVFARDQIPLLATLAQEAAVSLENARLFQLATTDGLTGLYSVRHFKSLLEYEMIRASRYQRALSLILLDIDFFKKINDTHGHLAGDLVLQELAKILRGGIRQIDIAARYGGDEFIVMLPEASGKEASLVAERIRKKAERAKCATGDGACSFTISLGIAAMAPRDSLSELIERADRQLYQAKNKGRNRTET